MREISQRELRNDNAQIMREIERGESFTVTRRGVPVARVLPYDGEADLPLGRAATATTHYADLPRVLSSVSTTELLDDLRSE